MEEFIYSAKKRPQRLCKMCGKCCTVALCNRSFEELSELSITPNSEAKDFLSSFIPYKDLDIPRKISAEYVDVVLETLKAQGKYTSDSEIFYHCKYINEDNSCSIYEKRYSWCHNMPNHGWTLVPCGCGFEGWQFLVREQIKHNIRQLKEYLYECEILYGDGEIPSKKITVAQLREKIMQKIKPFERFGSMHF